MRSTLLLLSLSLIVHLKLSAQNQTPHQEGSLFSIEVGGLRFEADSTFGAKISSLTLEGSEFLISSDMVSSEFLWGSTLWPSPQSEWGWNENKYKWDHQAFASSIDADTMTFTGTNVSVDKGDSFHFIKSFWANGKDSTLSLRYSMVNTTGRPIKKALWELTRVPVGGLTFWPTGPGGTWGDLAPACEEINNHTWYLRESEDGTGLKFFADGLEGWFAHVDDQNRLFIKTFEDVATKDFAEGEAEIELWVAEEYIELENQSKCAAIGIGDTLEYKVLWILRQLPDHIQVSRGNQELIDYVRWVISEKETTPTGIRPTDLEPDLKIYSNRSEGIIHILPGEIGVGKINYSILNLQGQILLQGELHNKDINISGINEGMYIIRLKTQKGFVSKLLYL